MNADDVNVIDAMERAGTPTWGWTREAEIERRGIDPEAFARAEWIAVAVLACCAVALGAIVLAAEVLR